MLHMMKKQIDGAIARNQDNVMLCMQINPQEISLVTLQLKEWGLTHKHMHDQKLPNGKHDWWAQVSGIDSIINYEEK